MPSNYKNLFKESLGEVPEINFKISVGPHVIQGEKAPSVLAIFPTRIDVQGAHTAAVAVGNRRDMAELLATAVTFMMQNALLEDVNALLGKAGLPTLEEKKNPVKDDSILPDALDFERYLKESLGIHFSTDDN